MQKISKDPRRGGMMIKDCYKCIKQQICNKWREMVVYLTNDKEHIYSIKPKNRGRIIAQDCKEYKGGG
jgi:hypothetical protein